MEKFVTSIKRKYRERLIQHEEQWPPVRGNRLIKLQLVEADKTEGFRAGLSQHGAPDDKIKRTPILHGDLFKVEEGKKPVRKLIVEGNAGIGKTTLCTMLTEEWANGEILTQFDCVLLLPLRERSVSTATTLPQLFKLLHSSERIRTSVIEELEEREGEGVLIIADGWDELDQKNRSKNSFVHDFLFGDLLPLASVLLTSRPSASALLHNLPTVDRLVEVVGFNEENVKQYIESEFEKCPEKASSLIEQLEDNPLIASVCSVPLNCAIVCNVWHTLDRTLPSTLTELYSQIVLNVILRNLKKRNILESAIALSLDSIPEDLLGVFLLTCKFAYECLSQNNIVFTQNEIAPLFPQVLDSSDDPLCFGLMQCARSLLPVGQGLSFHFVHLTIQEFLAALHLVTLPNEKKLKVCETHAESDRFAMVWRFVFGLGCQKEGSYSRKVIYLDDEVMDRFLYVFSSAIGDGWSVQKKVKLLLCHCSVESTKDTVQLKIAKLINGNFDIFNSLSACTPNDCAAVFHVLRYTSHFSNIKIVLSFYGLTDELLKELADILSSACGELQVRHMSLYDSKITDSGIIDMFSRAAASFSSLKELDLINNSITNIKPLTSSCHSLSDLSLSNNPLGVSGIQSLETAVQAGVLINLKKLRLSNTFTKDADINGALLATLSPSIASHCPHLKELDLSKNNLGAPGACALAELIISSSRAKISLNLRNTNINTEAASALTLSTRHCKNSRALKLNLSYNPLGYDGLLAILEMLKSETCPITKLYLDNASTDITIPFNTESLYHNLILCSTLENSKLTRLSLSSNNFSGDRVLMLAECMRVCKSLETLYCWSCSLTSSELIKIIDHLKSNSGKLKLMHWFLSDNSIDDVGVNALIECAPELLPCLEFVSLLSNQVSDEVNERLTEKLKVNEC